MTYDSVLAALADPTRRTLFEALRKGPLPVGQLAKHVTVSRPAVSQHLKVLETAGLVRARPEGASRVYAATPQGLRPLREYLETQWGEVLDAFAAHVTSEMENPDD